MYRLQERQPTDPTAEVDTGLSLTDAQGLHCGWVKEEDRETVQQLVDGGETVRLQIVRMGKRWSLYDTLLGQFRHFREGWAMVI